MDPSLAKFFDKIQADVAVAQKFLPTIESTIAVVASIFSPSAIPIVQKIAGAANVIVGVLGSLSAVTHPGAAATKPGEPVVIGETAQGVVITGHKL
jgi:hypothetical protein